MISTMITIRNGMMVLMAFALSSLLPFLFYHQRW